MSDLNTEGFDLGAFLSEARAAGTKDSEGSFTLEQDRSLKKLAKFNLPHPYDWVYKVVQAANAFHCERLIVKQRREATSFYFRPAASSFPDDEELITALKTGTYDKGGPIDTLSAALRALVDQLDLSFVLATRRRDILGRPIFSGHDTSGLSDRRREQWSKMSEQGLRLTVSHFTANDSITGRYIPHFSGSQRRDLRIANSLIKGTYSSIADVYLDGLRVSDPCLHPDHGAGRGGRPAAFGLIGQNGTGSLKVTSTFLNPHAKLNQLRKSNLGCGPAESWYYLRAADWLYLPSFERQFLTLPSGILIHWVRHGVIVARAKMRSEATSTSLHIFRNADNLRTDLTGLAVEIDIEEKQRAAEWAQQITEQLLPLPEKILQFVKSPPQVEATISGDTRFTQEVELGDTDTILSSDLIDFKVGHWANFKEQLSENWRRLLVSFSLKSRLTNWTSYLSQELESLQKSSQLHSELKVHTPERHDAS